MKTVHKFELPSASPGLFNITIPGFVKILSAKPQHSDVVIYALTESGCPSETIQIHIIMTGGMILFAEFEFLDTVMLEGDNYVLHVFWKHAIC